MKLHTKSLDIVVCQNFKSRLLGLYKSQPLGARSAVWLTKCRYVHTFGMREPLSLVFFNDKMSIVKWYLSAKPNRVYGTYSARSVIEMAQKTDNEFEIICQEILLLRQGLDITEYFNKGRIKTRIQNTTEQNINR